jgi:biopolymer transport protein ExbB/TolQ
MTAQKKGVIGIVVGVVLTVLGPVGGLLVTVLSLNRAFDATKNSGVAAENKAKELAGGISESMNATAIGIGIGLLGMVVLIVSIINVVRASKASRTSAGTPSS